MFLLFIYFLNQVDYGHEEVRAKFGKDPRQFSLLSQEFIDDGHGRVAGIRAVSVEWTKVRFQKKEKKKENSVKIVETH